MGTGLERIGAAGRPCCAGRKQAAGQWQRVREMQYRRNGGCWYRSMLPASLPRAPTRRHAWLPCAALQSPGPIYRSFSPTSSAKPSVSVLHSVLKGWRHGIRPRRSSAMTCLRVARRIGRNPSISALQVPGCCSRSGTATHGSPGTRRARCCFLRPFCWLCCWSGSSCSARRALACVWRRRCSSARPNCGRRGMQPKLPPVPNPTFSPP
ncbi:hypothetical protein GALL_546170 [mine drainage metagenome]|uniref:Uncharacterized protein n=1 Tax=mine drainage metagenome TaxID=410659 RepID=A0A1J5NZY3_9ZZZZ